MNISIKPAWAEDAIRTIESHHACLRPQNADYVLTIAERYAARGWLTEREWREIKQWSDLIVQRQTEPATNSR